MLASRLEVRFKKIKCNEHIQMSSQALLEALDEDGNGQISKDEFIKNALDIEFINSILCAEGENKK